LVSQAFGIIRIMPKECGDCRTIARDEDGSCQACGARSWRKASNLEAELSVLNWFSLLFMLGLIGFSYWFLVWRIQIK
jgi:hypothetical protein